MALCGIEPLPGSGPIKQAFHFFTTGHLERRVFGLDLLRCIAILFVVLVHGFSIFLKHVPWLQQLSEGYFGVVFFFILSGYLIGRILINITDSAEGWSLAALSSFFKRRWFRTLPNYYVVLGINLILGSLVFGTVSHFNPWYLVFMQSFFREHPPFMPVAWSLVCEEWFYLLFPSFLCGLAVWRGKGASGRNTFFLAALGFTVLFWLFRSSYYVFEDSLKPYGFIKMGPYGIYTIMYGIAAAYAARAFPEGWKRYRVPCLAAGLAMVLGVIVYSRFVPLFGDMARFKYVISPLIGAGCALLLPYLSEWKTERGWAAALITHISVVSYSMYLIHLSIVLRGIERLVQPQSQAQSAICFLIYLPAVVVASTALYHLVEAPFMRYRDRKYPR